MQSRPAESTKSLAVEFGPYRFDAATGQLWTDEREVRLSPKASSVLRLLVSHAGRPVGKEELLTSIWPGMIVTDNSLSRCIRELRAALGDDPKRPRFIETWHRRGYRFIAPIAGARNVQAMRAEPAAEPEPQSIAVLPFADMSPERDQDYLCQGLAEELIDALTHVDGLRVAARSSSFQFRGVGVDVREVGRKLEVGALLEGSVRKAGDRLRITVQLIDVANGYHKWSERFDRKLDDLFAIQEEIAQSVAMLLRGGTLSRRERQGIQRPETAAEAYEHYLRGRQLLHRMKQSELEQSRDMFARALRLDGSYPPAWAGLAAAHALLYEWFGASENDLEQADRASRKALELAPRLAEAHVARALVLSLSGAYEEAAPEFENAIAVNPHSFDAYYYYGRSCFAAGQVERSAELFRKASEVRREDFQSPILLEQSLRMLGRSDEARQFRLEGIARAERVLELNPLDGRALSLLATAYAEEGDFAHALALSQCALKLYPDDAGALIAGACVRAKAGLKEEALELLTRVFGRGCGKRDWIENDPDYDILREDPRFEALLERLK